MTVPTSPPLQSYANIQMRFLIMMMETIIQRVELADLADILLLKELATLTNPIRHLKTCLKWERRQCPGLDEIEDFLRYRKQTPPPLPTQTPQTRWLHNYQIIRVN